MQQQLINHSPDLFKLRNEGFDITVDGGYLITRHIPYVTSDKVVQYGTLICILTLATPTRTGIPPDHTIYFCGTTPCDFNGVALSSVINNSSKQRLTNELTVDHYFSSKPRNGNYPDYYEKIATYAKILGSQAQVLDSAATWKPIKNFI